MCVPFVYGEKAFTTTFERAPIRSRANMYVTICCLHFPSSTNTLAFGLLPHLLSILIGSLPSWRARYRPVSHRSVPPQGRVSKHISDVKIYGFWSFSFLAFNGWPFFPTTHSLLLYPSQCCPKGVLLVSCSPLLLLRFTNSTLRKQLSMKTNNTKRNRNNRWSKVFLRNSKLVVSR